MLLYSYTLILSKKQVRAAKAVRVLHEWDLFKQKICPYIEVNENDSFK